MNTKNTALKSKALTTNFIKEVRKREASNAAFVIALVGLASKGQVTAAQLGEVNERLNLSYKETGITTFKNVAMLIGRMYTKKQVKGKSVPHELSMYVVDQMHALKDTKKVSMKALQECRAKGKEKQVKTQAHPKDDAVIDVQDSLPVQDNAVLAVAKELATVSTDELIDELYANEDALEELIQHINTDKLSPQQLAVVVAKQKSLLDTLLSYTN